MSDTEDYNQTQNQEVLLIYWFIFKIYIQCIINKKIKNKK